MSDEHRFGGFTLDELDVDYQADSLPKVIIRDLVAHVRELDAAETKAIDERDAAEDCVSSIASLFGKDLSSNYGYKELNADIDMRITRNDELERVLQECVDILGADYQHLNYCGWGDNYERECARQDKLPERTEKALASAAALGVRPKGVKP